MANFPAIYPKPIPNPKPNPKPNPNLKANPKPNPYLTLNLTPYLTLKLTITLLSEFQNRTHTRKNISEFDSIERTRVILFLNSIFNFFYIKT